MARELTTQNVFMDRFVLEPKTQRVWDVPHATWFTLMGVGGGLFILARLLNVVPRLGSFLGMPLVDLLSLGAIAVGGLILIADLGRPLRFVRALKNIRTSWISRGAVADFIFLLAGGLLVIPDLRLGGARPFSSLPWDSLALSPAGRTLEIIAMLAAVVVMFYAGSVLADPRSIPYWNSIAIPLQFLFSSLAMSMGVIVLLTVANGEPVSGGQLGLLALFSGLLLASIVPHLLTRQDVPGKRESLDRLLRGRYRTPFVGGVILLGTVAPALLGLLGWAVDVARPTFAVVCCVLLLAAGFALRLITLRVGIFPPVRSVLPVNGGPSR